MLDIVSSLNGDSDSVLKERERYKLDVTIDTKNAYRSSNDFDELKAYFDFLVEDVQLKKNKAIIAIYDYDKNTNVEYYNTEDE